MPGRLAEAADAALLDANAALVGDAQASYRAMAMALLEESDTATIGAFMVGVEEPADGARRVRPR